MKNYVITVLLLHLFFAGVAQNIGFMVGGTYQRSIKQEKVKEVKTMKDINPGYPSSWITDYISTEISVTSDGKVTKAMSVNEILTTKQREIVNTADIGADIVIDVKYKKKNAITGIEVVDTMMYTVRVVPEVEADYIGGYEELTQYFEGYEIHKISEASGKPLQLAIVKFTVNEDGEITDARISTSSEDKQIDDTLLEAVNKMPNWSPAENSKGKRIKQDFELSIGSNIGC